MLNEIDLPKDMMYRSRTDWEPITFFGSCFCHANSFDLLLGFFSSSAFNVLSDAFAVFLYNGGKMRLVANDILSLEDTEFIVNANFKERQIKSFSLQDIDKLKEILSERGIHFFECLAWLIKEKRLEIKIIRLRSGVGIPHQKTGIFKDQNGNALAFNGSCNFTGAALVKNFENIVVSKNWDDSIGSAQIETIQNQFEEIFCEDCKDFEYIEVADLKSKIMENFGGKNIQQLLEADKEIFRNYDSTIKDLFPKNLKKVIENSLEKIRIESQKPKFPFSQGPRGYQKEAFECWKNNGQKGLFTMATGTGKTITALNCLLEIYKSKNYYKALILVPTITLVNQWEKECKKFNFIRVIKVFSKIKDWREEVAEIQLSEKLNSNKVSYIIISTYCSFVKKEVFDLLNGFSKEQLLLIMDEAHNAGAERMRKRLPYIAYERRIGLSATPVRQFDDLGNREINKFFNVINSQYTFTYSMKKAIEDGCLCRYFYYPQLVELTDLELERYKKISEEIAQFYNFEKDCFEMSDDMVKLLIKRKKVIHKAVNKKEILKKVLEMYFEKNKTLKYSLIYVPEGNDESDFWCENDFDYRENVSEEEHSSLSLISEYVKIIESVDHRIVVREFTSKTENRDELLTQFANGKVDVLVSMKCLDEGVDVPRSELAVFCASTGNPRQFIQRRGRILRTHPQKKFAIIYDLVVVPNFESRDSKMYKIERNLLNTEMKRVRDFVDSAENSYETIETLRSILKRYNLPIFQ